MSSDGTGSVQTVRNAWINRLRAEALRMRTPAVCKVVAVGFVIATYADADGSNAFPSKVTIAAITGMGQETVRRCIAVLMATELIERRRRPNENSAYQLVIPTSKVPWEKHLHLYTDNPQQAYRAKVKAKQNAAAVARLEADRAARTPSPDGVRTPSPDDGPDTIPGGVSEPEIQAEKQPGHHPRMGADTIPGRGPDTIPGGGDQYLPTFGRHPCPDHDMAEPVPQPQVGAGAGARGQDESSEAQRLDDIAARILAAPYVLPPTLQALPGGATPRPSDKGQRPLLLPVNAQNTVGPTASGVSDAEREQLRAAGAADLTRVLRAVDALGNRRAFELYGRRLVTDAINARTQTGT